MKRLWFLLVLLAASVVQAADVPIKPVTKFLVPSTDDKPVYAMLIMQEGKPVLLIGPSMDPWSLQPYGPQPTPVPDKLIESFTANPESVAKGKQSVLTWSAPKAKSVTLNGVPVAGTTTTVTPDATTTYTLQATDGARTETAQRIVTVTDTPPPVPPTPEPPVPEPPKPTSLRVLIMVDKLAVSKLPAEQREILLSSAPGSVMDYLDKNCTKEGDQPGYKVFDAATIGDGTGATDLWKNAVAEFKKRNVPVPGWLVTTGKAGEGEAGPLPAKPADALTTLKKWTPAAKGAK